MFFLDHNRPKMKSRLVSRNGFFTICLSSCKKKYKPIIFRQLKYDVEICEINKSPLDSRNGFFTLCSSSCNRGHCPPLPWLPLLLCLFLHLMDNTPSRTMPKAFQTCLPPPAWTVGLFGTELSHPSVSFVGAILTIDLKGMKKAKRAKARKRR